MQGTRYDDDHLLLGFPSLLSVSRRLRLTGVDVYWFDSAPSPAAEGNSIVIQVYVCAAEESSAWNAVWVFRYIATAFALG